MPRKPIDPAGLPSPDPTEIAAADPHAGSAPPPVRSTYTVAGLEVSEPTYREIRAKLVQADYNHVFTDREDAQKGAQGTGPMDLSGIALVPKLAPDADPLTDLPKPEDEGPLTVRALLDAMMEQGGSMQRGDIIRALVVALEGAGEETGVAWEHGHYVTLAANPEGDDAFAT